MIRDLRHQNSKTDTSGHHRSAFNVQTASVDIPSEHKFVRPTSVAFDPRTTVRGSSASDVGLRNWKLAMIIDEHAQANRRSTQRVFQVKTKTPNPSWPTRMTTLHTSADLLWPSSVDRGIDNELPSHCRNVVTLIEEETTDVRSLMQTTGETGDTLQTEPDRSERTHPAWFFFPQWIVNWFCPLRTTTWDCLWRLSFFLLRRVFCDDSDLTPLCMQTAPVLHTQVGKRSLVLSFTSKLNLEISL